MRHSLGRRVNVMALFKYEMISASILFALLHANRYRRTQVAESKLVGCRQQSLRTNVFSLPMKIELAQLR